MKLAILATSIYLLWLILRKKQKHNFLDERVRLVFNSKRNLFAKESERYSDLMMISPDNDIVMNDWENESTLASKSDIHKTRLLKFGRSKLNGETIYLDHEGNTYIKSKEGNKDFI